MAGRTTVAWKGHAGVVVVAEHPSVAVRKEVVVCREQEEVHVEVVEIRRPRAEIDKRNSASHNADTRTEIRINPVITSARLHALCCMMRVVCRVAHRVHSMVRGTEART
jgi:hypothetical protein